jgi:hypothetical protein
VRAGERERVRGDVGAALPELVDPFVVVDVDGVGGSGAECAVEEVGEQDRPVASWPDSAALFPVCGCGASECDDCVSDHVTPRTAAVLRSMAQLLADQASDDVVEHGDDLMELDDPTWPVFGEFTRITRGQDAIWRRRAAVRSTTFNTFDDTTPCDPRRPFRR